MDDWQSIETAPKNGSRILLYGAGEIEIARYVERNNGFGSPGSVKTAWEINVDSSSGFNYYNDFIGATHWKRLPDSPEGAFTKTP